MIRVTEQTIRNAKGKTVEIGESGSGLNVRWCCGETYSFSADDAREMLAHIDTLTEYGGVSMQAKDSRGTVIHLRVSDGNLYADTSPVLTLSDSYYVDLSELRMAAGRALRSLERAAVSV